VAPGITYFCTTWEGKEDGDLLLDRMVLFLKAYQDELRKQKRIGAIRNSEIAYLPVMIKASNLSILNWDVGDYSIKKPNPFEYLIYLQHNVRLMRWLENNWDTLVYSVQRALKES
jgi:homoserine kinase type II